MAFIATGASDLTNRLRQFGGSGDRLAKRSDAIKAILKEQEQARTFRESPQAFGRSEQQRALSQGMDPRDAARLAITRRRGTSGFQGRSRNIDPLSGKHVVDLIKDAQRLHDLSRIRQQLPR